MLDFTSSFDEREPVETSGAEATPPVSDTELLDAYSHAVISVAVRMATARIPSWHAIHGTIQHCARHVPPHGM